MAAGSQTVNGQFEVPTGGQLKVPAGDLSASAGMATPARDVLPTCLQALGAAFALVNAAQLAHWKVTANRTRQLTRAQQAGQVHSRLL